MYIFLFYYFIVTNKHRHSKSSSNIRNTTFYSKALITQESNLVIYISHSYLHIYSDKFENKHSNLLQNKKK